MIKYNIFVYITKNFRSELFENIYKNYKINSNYSNVNFLKCYNIIEFI